MNKLSYKTVLLATSLAVAGGSQAAVTLYEDDKGWNANLSGSFPVFFVYSDFKEPAGADTDGDGAGDGEVAARIMSGFNPSNLTFGVTAPKENGLVISGKMQINNHLQGSQRQNSGAFESRVAEIQIDGDFGTLNVGKGFGIFNSGAIGDAGSGLGVGLMSLGPDEANATNGRIGTGYVYANFNPRIMYSNSVKDGLSYKFGLFNPEEPLGTTTETSMPRLEGQVNFDAGIVEVWTGFMYQSLTVGATETDYTMEGYDVGGRLKMGAIGGTLAYTITKGIGADGLYGIGGIADAEVEGSQWYVEGTYDMDKTRFGVSYGVGAQDETDAPADFGGATVPEVENTLSMLFVHHRVTSHLRTMLELHSYKSESGGSTTTMEYTAFVLGTQLDF